MCFSLAVRFAFWHSVLMTNNKNHFLPGSRVEVVFCDLTNSWLEGKVLRVTTGGYVSVKLTGSDITEGLVVTRSPDRVKHVETCGFCCVTCHEECTK